MRKKKQSKPAKKYHVVVAYYDGKKKMGQYGAGGSFEDALDADAFAYELAETGDDNYSAENGDDPE